MSSQDHFLLTCCTDYFTVVQEYPVMLLTTVDPADNIMQFHTCLSHKFYFMFSWDAYNADPNEPSSDEDDENEVDNEDIFHEASNQWSEWHRSSCSLPYSVVHPSPPTSLIACSPSPLNGPPTSPVLHTNPLQQGKSLVTFSVLPHTIWTWAVTLIPGCYDGLFVGQQAILDKVYKLASRGPQNFKLDIWGTSVGLSIPPLCSC